MFNHEPAAYVCPLCQLVQGQNTEWNVQDDIVFANDQVIAYIPPKWWKNNPGHVLVIPREHVENVYDISEELLAEVQRVGKRMALAMKQAYACEGTSFRQHNEPAGNQAIWHYHLHVFPRWNHDQLYQLHNESYWVHPEEKAPYVAQLKAALSS